MDPVLKEYRKHLAGERNLSPFTIRNYLDDLAPFIQFLDAEGLGPEDRWKKLRNFVLRNTVQVLNQEYRRLLLSYVAWFINLRTINHNKRNQAQGHTRTSAVRNLASLRSFFRFLIAAGLMPAAALWTQGSASMRGLLPPPPKRLPQVLYREEVKALINQAKASPTETRSEPLILRDAAILELLYGSGLRLAELAGLDVSSLQLSGRTVRVFGKGNKERMVPISRPCIAALESYLAQGRQKLTTTGADHALFLNRYGGRLSQRSVEKIVQRYALRAGLTHDVHTHTLRHSFATHLLDGGADIRVVQELLGHANPSTTQVYTHVSPEQARKVYLSSHPRASRKNGDDVKVSIMRTVSVEEKT